MIWKLCQLTPGMDNLLTFSQKSMNHLLDTDTQRKVIG